MSVLDHCPPDVGKMLDCSPLQIEVSPVKLIVGFPFTVNGADNSDKQPVALFVKINLAEPAPIAVIIPVSSMVATASFVLAQVPPEFGVILEKPPIQRSEFDKPLIEGGPNTAIDIVSSETHQLVDSINVNVALPTDFPVTIPELFILATPLLLLIHIPPEVGDNEVVLLTQIPAAPKRETSGIPTTAIGVDNTAVQPSVDINKIDAFPLPTPVITPVVDMVTILSSDEDQTPLTDALTNVFSPPHIVEGPFNDTERSLFIVMRNVPLPAQTPVVRS